MFHLAVTASYPELVLRSRVAHASVDDGFRAQLPCAGRSHVTGVVNRSDARGVAGPIDERLPGRSASASGCRRSRSPRRRSRRTSRRFRSASPPSRRTTIENAGIHIVSEAAIFAPNTFFTEWSARKLSNARFRGISSSPNNPGITTYIDGVPQFNANSSSIELLDVDQIEFVRGPQSALFGRNTLGGLVNITSTPAVAGEVDGHVLGPVRQLRLVGRSGRGVGTGRRRQGEPRRVVRAGEP